MQEQDGSTEGGEAVASDDSSALGEPRAVSAAALAVEIAELKAQVAELQEESERRLGAWQRAQADYQNLKKRSGQEVEDRAARTAAALLLELLPVVDDFELALEAEAEVDPAAWAAGVRLIQRKLYRYLEQVELQSIAAEGQPFDPAFHEAMGQAPGPAGQVLSQLRKGYLWGGRLLRPAQVIVGGGAAEEAGHAEGAAAGPENGE